MQPSKLVYVPLEDAKLERLALASERERKSIDELVTDAVAAFLEQRRGFDL